MQFFPALPSASFTDTAIELRSTQTAAVLAKITPSEPYVSFTGVTAAADDRTFVLPAQGPERSSAMPSFPTQRFFLLRIDPAAQARARMTLTALPAGYAPAGHYIHDMALSPDRTQCPDLQVNDARHYRHASLATDRWSTATAIDDC